MPVLAWRKISLLATPIVLGLINLVDAYTDKQKGFVEGDQLYRVEVETGQIEAKNIVDEAEQSGRITKSQLSESGAKERAQIVAGATEKANETHHQAVAETEVIRRQAAATRGAIPEIQKR
jgi:hypothetical protein